MNSVQPHCVVPGAWLRAARFRLRSRAGLLGIVFLASGILSGCATKEASDEVPQVTVQVAAAQNKAIEREITAGAILYPKDQAALVPKINAPISKFYVNRGSAVRAGQLLAELESRDLASAVADNQGAYQQAEAAYQTAAQKAEQDLKLARQQLDAQQRVYDNRASLLKQGAASAKDVEDARIALTQAQNQYDIAQKQYDLRAAEGQLNSAKAKTSGAKAQLDYTRIVSPINGVVTDRPFYAGETAPSGSPILTVMDLSQVIARVHVSQQEAAQLKVGDAASLSLPGGDSVPGKVSLVSPALDPNSTTVEVWVQAPNPRMEFRPGAGVRVSMVAEKASHATVIPSQALLTAPDGATSVIVLDPGNTPQKRKVEVGIRNGNDVQITKGLKDGEHVVTVGAFELDKEDPDVLRKTKVQVEAPPAQQNDAGGEQ
jgi:HlyD family secretion protein